MGKQDLKWEFQVQLNERTKTTVLITLSENVVKINPIEAIILLCFFSMRQWLDGLLHVTSVSPVVPGRQQSDDDIVGE